MKDVTKKLVGENKMTKAQAQLELIKLNRNIEKKGVEYANELGQYNKSIVMRELQLLWDKKDILKKFIQDQLTLMPNYVVIESMKDITKTFVGENKMTIVQAQKKYNELYKTNGILWDLKSIEGFKQIRENHKEMKRLNDFIDAEIDKTSTALKACK